MAELARTGRGATLADRRRLPHRRGSVARHEAERAMSEPTDSESAHINEAPASGGGTADVAFGKYVLDAKRTTLSPASCIRPLWGHPSRGWRHHAWPRQCRRGERRLAAADPQLAPAHEPLSARQEALASTVPGRPRQAGREAGRCPPRGARPGRLISGDDRRDRRVRRGAARQGLRQVRSARAGDAGTAGRGLAADPSCCAWCSGTPERSRPR